MFCHKGTGLKKDTPANIECSEVQTPFVDIFHAGWLSFHARETQGTHTIIGRRPKPLVSQAFSKDCSSTRLKSSPQERIQAKEEMHHVPPIRNRLTATYGKPIRKRTVGSYDYKEPNSLAADFAVALIEFAFPCLLSCAVSNSPLLQTSQWRP